MKHQPNMESGDVERNDFLYAKVRVRRKNAWDPFDRAVWSKSCRNGGTE